MNDVSTTTAVRPRRRARWGVLAAAALLVAPLLGAGAVTAAVAAPGDGYSPIPVVLSEFKDPAQWQVYTNDGAQGTFRIDPLASVTGDSSGLLDMSIPSGTVEIAADVPATDLSALRFSVRSTTIDSVAVRLVDSTGQVHQQRVELDPAAAGWQTIVLESFDSGANYVSWGGPADGVWRGPVTRVAFVVDKWGTLDGATTGSLHIDALQALLPVPPFAVVPTTVGNAFDVGQPVTLGFVSSAQDLAWTVRDASGTVVDSGSGQVADLDGVIPVDATAPGWYQAQILATDADGTAHEGGTDFSILEPFDFTGSDDNRLAAATHFGGTWPLDLAPLLSRAGFSTARDEAYWSGQETTAGQFVWQEKVNAYQAELEQLDVDQLHVLSYGNPLYFADEAPSTPADRLAFANYALKSVEKFGTDDTIYEVWNEWNWRDLDGAAGGSAEQYVELLKVVNDVVRAEYPDVTLIGPALAPMNDWAGWMRDFAEAGGFDLVDGLSTHPYTFPQAPEGSTRYEGHIATLRSLMTEFGADLPMYLTEVGWPTSTNSQGVSELVQARLTTRAELLALEDGIAQYTIYDFMDDGLDAAEMEHRFGIVRNTNDPRGSFTPKPAYVSNAVLARQIHERPVLRSEDLGTGLYDVVFDAGSGSELHAAWSTVGGSLTFAATGQVTVTDLYGGTTTLTPDAAGHVYVSVGEDPVYVEGSITDVTAGSPFRLEVDAEVAGDATAGRVIADNTAGSAALAFEATAQSQTTSGTAAAGGEGEAQVSFAAQPREGARTYAATVAVAGATVARVTAAGTAAAPLSVVGTHAIAPDGQEQLSLAVHNSSTRDVTVAGVDWSVGDQTGTGLEGQNVAAGQSLVLPVAVDVTAAVDWSAAVRRDGLAPLTSSGKLVPVAATTEVPLQAIVVDGVVDAAVQALPAQDFLAAGDPPITGWSGPADASGSLWLTHDEENLYLTARITDDAHAQPATGGDIWQGDGLQWGFTTGAPGESPRVHELGAALTSAGVDVYRWAPTDRASEPEGVQSGIVRDDAAGVTTYELAVPWSTLEADPSTRLYSTTVVVNDNDGGGRDGWLTWGKGVAETKNAALYQPLLLGGAPAPLTPEPTP